MNLRERFIQLLDERKVTISNIASKVDVTIAPLYNFKNNKSGICYETAKELNRYFEVSEFEPCFKNTNGELEIKTGNKTTKGVYANEFEEGDVVLDLANGKAECKIVSGKWDSHWSRWEYKIKNSNDGLTCSRPEHHLKLKYKKNHIMPLKHSEDFEKAEPYNEEDLKDAYIENMVRDAMVEIEELKPLKSSIITADRRYDEISERIEKLEEKIEDIAEFTKMTRANLEKNQDAVKNPDNAKQLLTLIINGLMERI